MCRNVGIEANRGMSKCDLMGLDSTRITPLFAAGFDGKIIFQCLSDIGYLPSKARYILQESVGIATESRIFAEN